MIVASAAPSTPILNTIMKIRSPAILNRVEMIRKMKGVFESPRDLIIPESILYRNVNGIPRKITSR